MLANVQGEVGMAQDAGPTRARVIGICSLKGGVGKSTSAVQIAAALAHLGHRVLLVDADSNCSASYLCGVGSTDEMMGTIAAVVMQVQPLGEVVQALIPGLDLLRGTAQLRRLESFADVDNAEIAGPDGHLADWALRVALEPATERYDYVLVDCAGGHPKIIRMALLAMDEVIIPCGPSLVDVNGTAIMLELVRQAQEVRNEEGLPTFLGLLANGTGRHGLPAKVKAMLDECGAPYFCAIRQSATLKTMSGAARMESRFLVTARPHHPVTLSFVQVAREIEYGVGRVPPELMVALPDAAAGGEEYGATETVEFASGARQDAAGGDNSAADGIVGSSREMTDDAPAGPESADVAVGVDAAAGKEIVASGLQADAASGEAFPWPSADAGQGSGDDVAEAPRAEPPASLTPVGNAEGAMAKSRCSENRPMPEKDKPVEPGAVQEPSAEVVTSDLDAVPVAMAAPVEWGVAG
jgi:cellulose biosynthesis protein BcsQ